LHSQEQALLVFAVGYGHHVHLDIGIGGFKLIHRDLLKLAEA
jgi:hypothetical protein